MVKSTPKSLDFRCLCRCKMSSLINKVNVVKYFKIMYFQILFFALIMFPVTFH